MFSIFRRKKSGGLEKAEVAEKPQTGQDPLEARLGRTRAHLADLFDRPEQYTVIGNDLRAVHADMAAKIRH